jgi:hypothetical protein
VSGRLRNGLLSRAMPPRTAPASSLPSVEKTACIAAHKVATSADPTMRAAYDRFLAETMMAVRGANAAAVFRVR